MSVIAELGADLYGGGMSTSLHIGFCLFPRFTQLDLSGPAQVLSALPGATVHYAWKSLEPVPTDAGFSIQPTVTFEACPPLDVVCVPGGPGQADVMTDEDVLGFLRRQGEGARFVTSVCTGSLLLGAAGLLEGHEATSHWAFRDQLAAFGAKPKAARVVRDGRCITGGGVTAGIDFGLALAAELTSEEMARAIQLAMEYDPQPPFESGSPEAAGPEITERVRAFLGAG